MTAVKETRLCGITCNKGCASFMVILSSLYTAVCLSHTLTCRLYLKGYYSAAHISGMSFFCGLFVVVHHCCKLRVILGLSPRAYCGLQIFFNLWYFIFSTFAGIGYTVLSVKSAHYNFDYISAAAFCWFDAVLMLYLFVVVTAGIKSFKYETYQLENGKKHINNNTSNGDISYGGSSNECSLSSCCCGCFRVIFWILYIIFHILMMIFFFLMAYYPCYVTYDVYTYRDEMKDYLHNVEVTGYEPTEMYMKCIGEGNETLIIENGLGGISFMMENFIPKRLANGTQVCIYDRRGYGWSETVEHGQTADHFIKKPQMLDSNIDFLMNLYPKVNINVPFYYAGHSYGGQHVALLAVKYPSVVKGLIFLDSSHFSAVESIRKQMETIANFQATGLLHAALDTKILDYKEVFGNVLDFEGLPKEIDEQFISSIRSGYFFTSYLREWEPMKNREAYDLLQEALKDNIVNHPVLVIDAGNFPSDWFPKEHFSKYTSSSYHTISGATHESLVMSNKYADVVAFYIKSFIDDTSA